MSALAMILTAAMVVPGDGSEKVSMEIVQKPDISGEWEGTGRDEDGRVYRRVFLGPCRFRYEADPFGGDGWNHFIFEDGGKLRVRGVKRILGIYRLEGECLEICYSYDRRPTTFRGGNGQTLLILHRVKSRK